MKLANYQIFMAALVAAAAVISVKFVLHMFGLELVVLGTLHGSVVSGIIFVIGFILSATITDYKEAERIPAEISSSIENIYDDVVTMHANYPKFDLTAYCDQLEKTAAALAGDLRNSRSHHARRELRKLGELNIAIENAGVPANFIVKIKQQIAVLARHLARVNYIQRITFLPSAALLAWSIVALGTTLLLLTEIEPFLGGMILTGIITFIMFYVLLLIRVIATPFHDEGKTKDDVSLFLLERTIDRLRSEDRPGH